MLGVSAAEDSEPPDAEAGEDEWFPFDFVDVVSAEDYGDGVAYHEGCLEDALEMGSIYWILSRYDDERNFETNDEQKLKFSYISYQISKLTKPASGLSLTTSGASNALPKNPKNS